MCTPLCSFTVTFYPPPYFASTHKCMPAPCREVFHTKYSNSNHIPLTLSQTLTEYHTTDRTVICLIMTLIATSPSHSFAVQLKSGTNWTLPSFSLVFEQLSASTENITRLKKSPSPPRPFFFLPKQNYFEFWTRAERKRVFLLNLSSLC